MINALNAHPGAGPLRVVCRGDYSLRGCDEIEPPPFGTPAAGRVVGLPPLLRDNVEIVAHESSFNVPNDFLWRRVEKGGGSDDSFFVGWQLYGSSISFSGGRLVGCLSSRPSERGPKLSGFGGREFGFVLGGEGWQLNGVSVVEWGTDCILAGSTGILNGSHISRGRRNNISVVPFKDDCDVLIRNCRIDRAGDWPEDLRNRPGAGLQVESGRRGYESTVSVERCNFLGNREKDLQLSKGATRCTIVENVFSNHVNLRPGNLGGHRIIDNIFKGPARMDSVYGSADAPQTIVSGNRFDIPAENAVRIRRLRHGKNFGQRPNVIID